jgi:hypothetical protein
MAKKKAKKKAKRKKAVRKPMRKKKRPTAKKQRMTRVERELEEGLRETFPGSDPLAQTDPTRSIKE